MLTLNSFGQDWSSGSSGKIYYNQGNVGIGVTDPLEKLHVNGNVNIGYHNKLGFALTDNFLYDGKIQPHYGLQWVSDTESPGSGSLWLSANGGIKLFTRGQVRFRIHHNGNIGIGTTEPKEKLHVAGNLHMNIGEGFKIMGNTSYFGTYLDGIIFQMEDANSNSGKTDGGFVFQGFTPKDEITKEWMVIRSPGNVGIGTTNPDSKLSVNGNIRAKEVKVEATNWPDYVFLPDYTLLPLDELEIYINNYGHLPNIPTEAAIQQDGLKLGEMNAKLLEKVEELTLYLIALKKENEQINRRLELLESK